LSVAGLCAAWERSEGGEGMADFEEVGEARRVHVDVAAGGVAGLDRGIS